MKLYDIQLSYVKTMSGEFGPRILGETIWSSALPEAYLGVISSKETHIITTYDRLVGYALVSCLGSRASPAHDQFLAKDRHCDNPPK